MILLVICTIVLFVWAMIATALVIVANGQNDAVNGVHAAETAALKKVGGWYEGRVAELENENRSLAEQLVASGAIRHMAMPLPTNDDYAEYATDDTGLVSERLDPRDVALGQ